MKRLLPIALLLLGCQAREEPTQPPPAPVRRQPPDPMPDPVLPVNPGLAEDVAGIVRLATERRDARGNQLAVDKAGREFAEAVAAFEGRPADWTMRLMSVTEEGGVAIVSVQTEAFASHLVTVTVTGDRPLGGLPTPLTDRVLAWRPGDRVRVRGTVSRATCGWDDFSRGYLVKFALKGVSLE